MNLAFSHELFSRHIAPAKMRRASAAEVPLRQSLRRRQRHSSATQPGSEARSIRSRAHSL